MYYYGIICSYMCMNTNDFIKKMNDPLIKIDLLAGRLAPLSSGDWQSWLIVNTGRPT